MDMVERVARAMAPMIAESSAYWCEERKWMDCSLGEKCECRGYAFAGARAAIAAMSEPTPEMANAFCKTWRNPAFHGTDTEAYILAFAAMIDAALTSSEPQAQSSE